MKVRLLLPSVWAVVLLSMIQLAHTSWWYLAIVGVHDNFQHYPIPESPNDQLLSRDMAARPVTHRDRCHRLNFLTPVQRRYCGLSIDIPKIVGRGAQWGIEECQHQFRKRRWNCTTFNETSLFGRVLKHDSRETAYIYAISSAGVVTSVTKACAKGTLDMCSCDNRVSKRGGTRANWEWGGCSHDVRFGNKFARQFVDSVESRASSRGLMNLWNNRAGRKAVKSNMERLCKCHGVSGTCTVKVCWKVIRKFRRIGSFLKEQFDGASKMKFIPFVSNQLPQHRDSTGYFSPESSSSLINSAPSSKPSRRRRRRRKWGGVLMPVNPRQKRPTKRDLVYLQDSPDFCDHNPAYGSLGTRGRECNITSYGLDGCALMCCGRDHYSREAEVVEDCQCKFHWCCHVICKKCRRTVQKHFCH